MSAILMISAVAMAAMLMFALPARRTPVSHPAASQTPADHAARLLAARYARGEISAYDYHRVRQVLYS